MKFGGKLKNSPGTTALILTAALALLSVPALTLNADTIAETVSAPPLPALSLIGFAMIAISRLGGKPQRTEENT